MPEYRLTAPALRDITGILDYLTTEASPAIAERTEDKLFELFEVLARNPGIGHRRQDITSRDVRFHPLRPYMVVYEPGAQPIMIHGVLHSSRDVRRILDARL